MKINSVSAFVCVSMCIQLLDSWIRRLMKKRWQQEEGFKTERGETALENVMPLVC